MQRALNVAVALVLMAVALPAMVLIAVLVALTSRGPILYTQWRVGVDRRFGRPRGSWRRQVDYGGRLFKIYKFRTMQVANGPEKQVWAQPGDPRVTRLGRVLRSYRLDELPQLWNVLRGDMNIVGPRPEQPMILMRLREEIEGYADRQRVLPGITGWAQVNHHYDRCLDDVRRKVQLDLEYAARQSALEDMKIMLRTVPVMILRKGAC
jgi:lipopolysaccharide/colanic/teichoic acid biosynthesis glycosyltransferase